MSVNYNSEFGTWQVNGRGSYPTEAAARQADGGAVISETYDEDEFTVNTAPRVGAAPVTRAPAPAPVTTSSTPTKPKPANLAGVGKWQWTGTDWKWVTPEQAYTSGNIGGVGGAYNVAPVEAQARMDQRYDAGYSLKDFARDGVQWAIDPVGKGVRTGVGAVLGDNAGRVAHLITNPLGAAGHDIVEGTGFNGSNSKPAASIARPPAATGGAVQGTNSTNVQNASLAEQEAENEFDVVGAEEEAQTNKAEQDLLSAIDGIGRENNLSKESRGQQQQALAMQSDLLKRVLGYDPNAYAQQFADSALASATALGRSAPGGAAGRQQGIYAALEQMPAIEAEAQRQAQTLENQRLTQAQAAVGKFGDLAFGVRAQDAGEEEFNAGLTVEVADQFAGIFNTQSAQEVQKLNVYSNIWIETMRNTRGYAEMDSNERMALWRNATEQYGMELDFDAKMKQIQKQFPDQDPIDVWLDRFSKGGAAVVSAKTGGLI